MAQNKKAATGEGAAQIKSRLKYSNDAASQRSRLLEFLRKHGSLSTIDARHLIDVLPPSVREMELCRQGHDIMTVWAHEATIGETVARLSAGANENAGQDMWLVVRLFDRIRTTCNAHFALIHHSRKAVAPGARGWSGIRVGQPRKTEVL